MIRKLLQAVWASAMVLQTAVGIAAANDYNNTTDFNSASVSGYRVGETPDSPSTSANTDSASSQDGPVRLARFSYVQGNVTWRGSDDDTWATATINQPIRQGAQIWVSTGGRAEVQFDDGSLLRLGTGAVVQLKALNSDSRGEYTELTQTAGLSALRLRHPHSIYAIDTPFASVNSEGPSKVRIGVDNTVELAVREGSAYVQGKGGTASLNRGSYLDIPDESAPYDVASLPGSDSWDRWNDDRDNYLADLDTNSHLPSNIALVAGDLGNSGTWREVPTYGWVWCPRDADHGWRPYQNGRWAWVEPFGWTWVSNERWGWAPYHYGTWVELSSCGWAWVPGPANQFWCPGVVHFCENDGRVGWAPLCPDEVRYPSVLAIGIRDWNWSLYFSIGGCAVYYPTHERYCEPRRWDNRDVNRRRWDNGDRHQFNNTTVNVYNTYNNHGFVPFNGSHHDGLVTSPAGDFGRGGHYDAGHDGATFYRTGKGIGAPDHGSPVAGPVSVHPTRDAFGRGYTNAPAPPQRLTDRPVFTSAPPPTNGLGQHERNDNVVLPARVPQGSMTGSDSWKSSGTGASTPSSPTFPNHDRQSPSGSGGSASNSSPIGSGQPSRPSSGNGDSSWHSNRDQKSSGDSVWLPSHVPQSPSPVPQAPSSRSSNSGQRSTSTGNDASWQANRDRQGSGGTVWLPSGTSQAGSAGSYNKGSSQSDNNAPSDIGSKHRVFGGTDLSGSGSTSSSNSRLLSDTPATGNSGRWGGGDGKSSSSGNRLSGDSRSWGNGGGSPSGRTDSPRQSGHRQF